MSRKIRTTMRLGFIVLLAGLAGCDKERLVKVLPPDVRVDTYLQQSASQVDVLWVIDNSGSMAPRQENLAKNFQSFIDVFAKGSIDFRIGVTTTDIFKQPGQFVGSPRVLTPSTPTSPPPSPTTSRSAFKAALMKRACNRRSWCSKITSASTPTKSPRKTHARPAAPTVPTTPPAAPIAKPATPSNSCGPTRTST